MAAEPNPAAAIGIPCRILLLERDLPRPPRDLLRARSTSPATAAPASPA